MSRSVRSPVCDWSGPGRHRAVLSPCIPVCPPCPWSVPLGPAAGMTSDAPPLDPRHPGLPPCTAGRGFVTCDPGRPSAWRGEPPRGAGVDPAAAFSTATQRLAGVWRRLHDAPRPTDSERRSRSVSGDTYSVSGDPRRPL